MNYQEYIQLVKRTESIPSIIGFGEDEVRFIHAAMGLNTEAIEYQFGSSIDNSLEELGDIAWYSAILLDVLASKNITALEIDSRSVLPLAGDILDLAKRRIFYGKAIDWEKANNLVKGILAWVETTARGLNWSLSEVFEANIKKLEKRYPSLCFDPVDAVNRNVKNELSHLETYSKIANSPAPKQKSYEGDPLSYPRFVKILGEAKPNMESLKWGGSVFNALSQHARKNKADALAEAYKMGYIKLLATRTQELNQATLGIWQVLRVWAMEAGIKTITEELVNDLFEREDLLCMCRWQ
ncbi:hypothetical protein FBPa48_0023 [Pseudomonas phage vB_PaeP_FBPa48]|nr:hypothetical protein FBPa48_0023 [Pseudomonas phage vB_PaeP_FBPa48]